MNIKIGILNVPKHGNKHDLIHFVTPFGPCLPIVYPAKTRKADKRGFASTQSGLSRVHVIFFNCINLSQAVVELLPYIHKLTTDGRTNTMFIGRSLSTGRAMC